MRSFAWLACLVVAGCTDPSVGGTVDQQPFSAQDAYFTTSVKAFPQRGSITYTTVTFSSWENACDFAVAVPTRNIQISAALYTGDPLSPVDSDTDLSVHVPGRFPVTAIDGNRAFADWSYFNGNTGESRGFASGAITIDSLSSEQLDGSLDWKTADGDHVSGTFGARRCDSLIY